MGIFRVMAIGAGLSLLVGCQSASAPRTARAPSEERVARVAPAQVERSGAPAGSAISPIENYRQTRLLEAMRGLRYDGGVVQVDEKQAAEVIARSGLRTAAEAYALGQSELDAGNAVEAIAAFTQAVIRAPDEPAYLHALGGALILKGRVSEAQAAFRTVLNLDPARQDTRMRLAETHQMLGDQAAANAVWSEVLSRDPAHGEAHARLAIGLYYLGDYAGAWAHVHAAEAVGYPVPPQFRPLLARQMPEPR